MSYGIEDAIADARQIEKNVEGWLYDPIQCENEEAREPFDLALDGCRDLLIHLKALRPVMKVMTHYE